MVTCDGANGLISARPGRRAVGEFGRIELFREGFSHMPACSEMFGVLLRTKWASMLTVP